MQPLYPTNFSMWSAGNIQYSKFSASKNTDSSVFYTEIETKILNTDSDPKNTDSVRVIDIEQITVTLQ